MKKRLIDANKAKFFIADVLDTFNVPVGDRMAERLIRAIDALPTEDAEEVVHGRWLKTCIPDIYHCTNCKRATKMDELCDSEILRAYCPNCGAKMDGERKDNDRI